MSKTRFLFLHDYQHGLSGCFVWARSRAELEAVLPRPPFYSVIEDDIENHPFVRGRLEFIEECDIDAPNAILQEALDFKPIEDARIARLKGGDPDRS